jgi:hypothetical protein
MAQSPAVPCAAGAESSDASCASWSRPGKLGRSWMSWCGPEAERAWVGRRVAGCGRAGSRSSYRSSRVASVARREGAVACDVSTAVHARASVSAYHIAEACDVTLALDDDDEDRLDERLRVPVLARADGAWLGMGAGLARAENISSLGSRLTSPSVAATACASCASRASARASAAASCAESTTTLSKEPTPAAAPPS